MRSPNPPMRPVWTRAPSAPARCRRLDATRPRQDCHVFHVKRHAALTPSSHSTKRPGDLSQVGQPRPPLRHASNHRPARVKGRMPEDRTMTHRSKSRGAPTGTSTSNRASGGRRGLGAILGFLVMGHILRIARRQTRCGATRRKTGSDALGAIATASMPEAKFQTSPARQHCRCRVIISRGCVAVSSHRRQKLSLDRDLAFRSKHCPARRSWCDVPG